MTEIVVAIIAYFLVGGFVLGILGEIARADFIENPDLASLIWLAALIAAWPVVLTIVIGCGVVCVCRWIARELWG